MHVLRLINIDGEVVREVESRTPWRVEFRSSAGVPQGLVAMVCYGSGATIYPSDSMTLELLQHEAVPA